jgi:hypothetical protein
LIGDYKQKILNFGHEPVNGGNTYITFPPITEKQYGGTDIFSINNTAHRVIAKGYDNSHLGRWSWTTLRRKNEYKLTIITAYRPSPPSAGVMGAYAQHSKYFNSISHNTYLREAFIQDLRQEIERFQELGHHIIVMLDGNKDMRRENLAKTFINLHLREVILQKHGRQAPSTCRRNTRDIPIDGIWASLGLTIMAGGYFAMDEVIPGTDHRALWIDINHQQVYGYTGIAPALKPTSRRLNNSNPDIRNNFNKHRKTNAESLVLLDRIISLERSIQGNMTACQKQEYETIDRVRRLHVRSVEKNVVNYVKEMFLTLMFYNRQETKLKAGPYF